VPLSPYMKKLRAAMAGEMLKVPGVAAVIRNDRGEVLITRRADGGGWDLAAGGIEPGETPSGAIVREVKEETGLEVRVRAVAGVFSGERFRHRYPDGQIIEAFTVVFDCEVTGGVLRSLDGEVTGFRYCAPDDLPELTWPYPAQLFVADRGDALFV
jgi:mutator protein MutT